ncbi:hypothetical protein YPPY56_0901, partial [Yersinia pestis PY-56]
MMPFTRISNGSPPHL